MECEEVEVKVDILTRYHAASRQLHVSNTCVHFSICMNDLQFAFLFLKVVKYVQLGIRPQPYMTAKDRILELNKQKCEAIIIVSERSPGKTSLATASMYTCPLRTVTLVLLVTWQPTAVSPGNKRGRQGNHVMH